MIPVIGEIRPWADPTVLQINRLATSTRSPCDQYPQLALDGEWSFGLFDHPDQVPSDAVTPNDTGITNSWATVDVPGNWTMQVADDLPHYTNVDMPFGGPPPRLPDSNPTGVYRRQFSAPEQWGSEQVVLHIAGAESVHAAYLNGHFVGYGTDSRLPSEYDITNLIRPGSNHLAIVVVRYSAHSYIEDQDQWWMAGLHRRVLIEARPRTGIADVETDADWDPSAATGCIEIRSAVRFSPQPAANHTLRSRIETLDGESVGEPQQAPVPHKHAAPYKFKGFTVSARWTSLNVKPWSAESPNLYLVHIELIGPSGQIIDTASQRVGFRRVEVRDRQLLVNGQPIWVFGVNRHDHHPDRGKAVTVDDMRADLLAMRTHNITAIRTAHYPNDSAFLDLCDELGFYVVDEANIECHAYNRSLCNDPTYRAAWLDRGARMVQRDRNHPSVIVWSLGNESGYGTNTDAEAGWIRSADPTRPLHYEDAIRVEGWVDGGRHATDIVCPMYPEIADISEYGQSGLGDRPLILCEYSHAMGNSNGSLGDYWDAITSTPGLQGGFIWEWKDHGLRQQLPDGATRLAYGGQFGEDPHDCNFVADGLMSADLEPHPAMKEVAWVHRPVTVSSDNGSLRIENRQSFSQLDWLTANWELLVNGVVASSDRLEVPAVEPHSSASIDMPCDNPASDNDDVSLVVRWTTNQDTWWARSGHLVSWDQIVLNTSDFHLVEPNPLPTPSATTARGLDVLVNQPRLNLWRASTDNDGFKLMPELSIRHGIGGQALRQWQQAKIDTLDNDQIVDHQVERTDDQLGASYRHIVDVPESLDDLGRVGVMFNAPARFDHLRWHGRGPHENYPDRNRSAMVSIWEGPIDECPYLVPQEFGLRTECRWFELVDTRSGQTIRIDSLAWPLHISAVRHSPIELFTATTATELEPRNDIVVCVDVAHRGLGTASCGPDVLAQYRIPTGRHEIHYRISTY